MTYVQSWTLIRGHKGNMAKNCFFGERVKSAYFRSAISDWENKLFFLSGLGTRLLLTLFILVSSQ